MRLSSLTGARALAAAAVFAHHVVPVLLPVPGAAGVARVGYLGVLFFFALSGFVLAYSGRSQEQARSFLTRRVVRIWPLHVVLLVAALPLAVAEGQAPAAVTLVACLFLVQAWSPDPQVHFGVDGPAWSLSAEMSFYLVTPVLARLGAPRYPVRACQQVLVLWAAGHLLLFSLSPAATWAPYVLPLSGFPLYLCGYWLGLTQRSGALPLLAPRRVLVFGGLSGVAVVLVSAALARLGVADPAGRGLCAVVVAPALLLLLVVLAQGDVAGRKPLLAHPALVRAGEASFAFYLVHQPVLRLLAPLLPAAGPVTATASTAAVAVTCCGLAYLLHRLVELPASRLGGRLLLPVPSAPVVSAGNPTVPVPTTRKVLS